MVLEPIKPEVLAVRMIPRVDPQLAARLSLDPTRHRTLGMITCTSDDALYASLDEGTKAADADVVYAKSFYAGAAHASGPFSGEIIGMFGGPDEQEVRSAIEATLRYLETRAYFYAADDSGKLAFFPHVLPSTGRYLSRQADVPAGTPMAYLIAPPIEATLGLDAALKAAKVELRVYYPPPSETNFSGGLLTGDQPEVEAAAQAFQDTVLDLAARPRLLTPTPELLCLAESFSKVARQRASDTPTRRYRLWGSGFEVDEKPLGYTHLFDDRSLVKKTHPAIRFRGKLDSLQAHVLDAQLAAIQEGMEDVAKDLDDVLRWLRGAMASEVTGRPLPELVVSGLSAEELHTVSHATVRYLGVGWVVPNARMGATAVRLNLLRACCRETEIAAMDAFGEGGHLNPEIRDALFHGLNRLSNVIYVLVCKVVARVHGQSAEV